MTDADQAPETAVERWIRKNPETADGVGFPVDEYEAEVAVSRGAVLATDRLQVRVAELEALRDGWRRAAQDLRAARDEAQRIARTLFHQNPGPRDAAVELDVHLGFTTPPEWLGAKAAAQRPDGEIQWGIRVHHGDPGGEISTSVMTGYTETGARHHAITDFDHAEPVYRHLGPWLDAPTLVGDWQPADKDTH